MIRALDRRKRSHKIWPDEVNKLITSSLGINPRKGGSPPKEKSDKNERVLVFILEIDLICLKWKIWFEFSRRITEEDTSE